MLSQGTLALVSVKFYSSLGSLPPTNTYPFVASDLILKKATAVETTVYGEFGDVNADYRNKMRRLYLNLKDKSNKRLRESVVDGDLPVARFCSMTPQVRLGRPRPVIPSRNQTFKPRIHAIFPQEMASEERKQTNKTLEEANMFKSLGAQEQEAETDAFQCGRCKQVSRVLRS